jgi:hypothetical protein
MGESISTSYLRRSAWTHRAKSIVSEALSYAFCATTPEVLRLRDTLEWLCERQGRIMGQCLLAEAVGAEPCEECRADEARKEGAPS